MLHHNYLRMSETTKKKTVMIVNAKGLHARAAARMTKLANQFDCTIKIHHKKNTACAKDILDLLTLAASQGCEITVEAFSGTDTNIALKAITHLVENGFEEDQTCCAIKRKHDR